MHFSDYSSCVALHACFTSLGLQCCVALGIYDCSVCPGLVPGSSRLFPLHFSFFPFFPFLSPPSSFSPSLLSFFRGISVAPGALLPPSIPHPGQPLPAAWSSIPVWFSQLSTGHRGVPAPASGVQGEGVQLLLCQQIREGEARAGQHGPRTGNRCTGQGGGSAVVGGGGIGRDLEEQEGWPGLGFPAPQTHCQLPAALAALVRFGDSGLA